MRKFFVLVKKEVKELLTPQIMIPLLITVLLFLFMGKIVGEEGKRLASKQSISVIDLDKMPTSKAIIAMLSKADFRTRVYEGQSVNVVIEETKKSQGTMVLVIPRGFENSLTGSKRSPIEAYALLSNFSFARMQAGSVGEAISAINNFLGDRLITAAAPHEDPQRLKNPVDVKEHVIVGKRIAAVSLEQVTGFVMSQTVFIPIILFIVIVLAAQMIATAIATEKENKTLETLLSIPVNRSVLVLAKMVAAGLLALLAAVVYMFSFRYYMTGLTGGALTRVGGASLSQAVRELGLVLTPPGYAVLGLSLFLGILCALAVAIILGAFAEEVKSVQALITPLMIVVLIPYVLVTFLDINTMSPWLKYLVLAIPFSHPFLAAPNLYFQNYQAVLYGIAYQVAFFAVSVYIAGRIFSSDRILTMKLRLKRTTST